MVEPWRRQKAVSVIVQNIQVVANVKIVSLSVPSFVLPLHSLRLSLVDCTQEDVDPDVCSLENQVLCEESESFAFECRHLCGKC